MRLKKYTTKHCCLCIFDESEATCETAPLQNYGRISLVLNSRPTVAGDFTKGQEAQPRNRRARD